MKKAIKTFFALLFMTLTISGALAAEKTNKPEVKTIDNYIAVFDFEITTGDKGISRPLTDNVIHELSQSDKYEVIDRGNMNKILKEQKLQMSGCISGGCVVQAGQLLGVGKIVTGSVGIVGKTYHLTLQLINVQTGKIEISVADKCKCELDELIDSTTRLAKKLLGEKVEQPAATAPKPATVAESKAEGIARAEATAKTKAEEIARAKTEADELARQKALDAEREQLATERRKFEAERQQLAVAKRPSQPTTGETARDGHFAYSNGTVSDTRTNLMWAAKDNGSNINWVNAKSYCENYRGGGYTDWRMPTQDELAGLYDSNKSYKATQRDYNVRLTELIQLSACCPWASETRGSDAAVFDFGGGGWYWYFQSLVGNYRALPVRSGK